MVQRASYRPSARFRIVPPPLAFFVLLFKITSLSSEIMKTASQSVV